ncbi:hypothetical protein ACB092_01G424400 [Castanea dentata]
MGKSRDSEIHQEASTSSGNETQIEGLVKDITTMFASLQPPFSITGRINVPDHLRNRKVAEEVYTPQVISIGPIHHSTEKLRPMEKCKVWYLECFISRAKTNLENLVNAITEMEKNIRPWYAETIVSSMSSDDFVKMILMDAIFILELFFRDAYPRKEQDDPIRAEPWLPLSVRIDLMLLENQLPFFVLKKLFDLSFPDDSNSLSLIKLSFKFFESYNFQRMAPEDVDVNVEILHLTDLIRTFLLRSPLPGRNSVVSKLLYSATQLQEAGVKFKVNSKNSLLDIKFDSKHGVLEMPSLEIYEETIILFRNLITLEQSCYLDDAYITDYVVLLNFLIDTTKDMDLLCEKGILVNYVRDNNTATTAFNDLNNYLIWSVMNSDYVKICEELNAFYKKSWHRWKATLRNQYFSSPWRSASTIAAIILLVLTFIQTVFSIIQSSSA